MGDAELSGVNVLRYCRRRISKSPFSRHEEPPLRAIKLPQPKNLSSTHQIGARSSLINDQGILFDAFTDTPEAIFSAHMERATPSSVYETNHYV